MLLKAYALDSTFMEPLIKLAKYYSTRRKFDLCDSLLLAIQQKNQSLTSFEVLRMRAISARNAGNFEKSGQLNLQIAEKYDRNYYNNAMGRFIAANNIGKALEILPSIVNLQDISNIGIRQEGTLFRPIFIHNQLGNYEKVLAMMDTVYQNPKNVLKINTVPINHLRAYLHLDSMVAAYKMLDFYGDKKNLSLAYSNKNSPKVILRWFAYDIYRLNKPITPALEKMLLDAKLEYELAFIKEDYKKCMPFAKAGLAKYPNSKYWIAMKAIFAAHLGNRKEAENLIATIHATPATFRKGDNEYSEAVIRTAFGEYAAAVELLRKAHAKGFDFASGTYQYDPALKPLLEYPAFLEFVRPIE